MKVIYNAENIIDANLVKGILEQSGLHPFVNGSFLQGGIGELPASGLITVAVPDQEAEQAQKIVKDIERERAQHT